MIWFILHNTLKQFKIIGDQTRNLTVFLIGVTLYTFIYAYIGSKHFDKDSFIYRLFMFFLYIILADGFAMAIIYKNFYGKTILTEMSEVVNVNNINRRNIEDVTYNASVSILRGIDAMNDARELRESRQRQLRQSIQYDSDNNSDNDSEVSSINDYDLDIHDINLHNRSNPSTSITQ